MSWLVNVSECHSTPAEYGGFPMSCQLKCALRLASSPDTAAQCVAHSTVMSKTGLQPQGVSYIDGEAVKDIDKMGNNDLANNQSWPPARNI